MDGNAVPHCTRRKESMRRTVAEHQQAVAELLLRCWTELPSSVMNDVGTPVPLSQTVGRVLAQDLVAPLDLPPFANSQMDGYAIHAGVDAGTEGSGLQQRGGAADAEPTTYRVAPVIAAGAVPAPLQPGMAAPIMTGAAVPAGANAIVPIELAHPNTFGADETVQLPATNAGKFVRLQGSDVQRGTVVIPAGTVLNAAHLGLASALGLTELTVRRRLRALLLTTGDEVLSPGDPAAADGLPPGMIYDANQALLRACLEDAHVEVLTATTVRDDPAELIHLLEGSVQPQDKNDGAPPAACDLIISVGGISAGAFEVVKQALGSSADAQMDFVSVGLQPGGPQGMGTYRGVPFLGFPGNPVSAFVSLEMFLRPALFGALGSPLPRSRVVAALEYPLSSPLGKHQVRRGHYSGPEFESAPSVHEVGGESSHLLGALAQANALIHVPAGATELQAGAKVEVWLL